MKFLIIFLSFLLTAIFRQFLSFLNLKKIFLFGTANYIKLNWTKNMKLKKMYYFIMLLLIGALR